MSFEPTPFSHINKLYLYSTFLYQEIEIRKKIIEFMSKRIIVQFFNSLKYYTKLSDQHLVANPLLLHLNFILPNFLYKYVNMVKPFGFQSCLQFVFEQFLPNFVDYIDNCEGVWSSLGQLQINHILVAIQRCDSRHFTDRKQNRKYTQLLGLGTLPNIAFKNVQILEFIHSAFYKMNISESCT